jgi:hypothetical protein
VEGHSKIFVVFVSIGSVDYVLDDTIDYFAPAGALRGRGRIGFRRFTPPAIVCRPFGAEAKSQPDFFIIRVCSKAAHPTGWIPD